MADPLHHDDMLSARREIYRLTMLGLHVMDDQPELPALTALAQLLLIAAENSGVDPEAVLHQVSEARERGDLQVTDDEVADIDAALDAVH